MVAAVIVFLVSLVGAIRKAEKQLEGCTGAPKKEP